MPISEPNFSLIPHLTNLLPILIRIVCYDCLLILVGLNFSNSVYFIRENETDVSVQLLLSFDEDFNQSFEVEFITLNNTAEGNT